MIDCVYFIRERESFLIIIILAFDVCSFALFVANIVVGIFIANLILPNSINILVIIIVNLTLTYNTIRHYEYITPLHVQDLA